MSTIVGLLEEAERKFGGKTALVGRQGYRVDRWSFSQLWNRSYRVAAWLEQEGVSKGDRVILWAHNSPSWVAAFFGGLRLGAILVPLDIGSSPEFVDRVREQTQAKLTLLSDATAGSWSNSDVPAVRLEDLEKLIEKTGPPPQENLGEPLNIEPQDVAEVIYTSGTTGDPKGVVLTHRNIVANVLASGKMVPGKPSYRLLSILPLSHMLEQTVGLLAPLVGGASVCYPQSRRSTVIFRAFKDHRITTMVLVPQVLQLMSNAIETRVKEQGKERTWRFLHRVAPWLPMRLRRRLFAPVHRQLGGSLKFIICGGAYLDPALARNWENLGVPVVQGYGTTEAAPIVSCDTLSRRKPESVGKAVPGVEVKIADSGEILIRGDNVTSGYWQNPQATQDAFDDGWYKTGDLGFLDQEGSLYLKGRVKDLIVLSSGLNVYPEDIETALGKHPGIADAVVLGLPQGSPIESPRESPTALQDVQVHAVLLMREGESAAGDIVEQVNAGLASYQRIQGFTVWPEEDFPRTHTLKVRKHLVLEKLQKDKSSETAPVEQPEAPTTQASPLVRLLARFTQVPEQNILTSSRLGIDLGLDSLGLVEVLAAVENDRDIYLDESQVGEETTVADLESMIDQGGQASQASPQFEWPLNPFVTTGRTISQTLLVFPIIRALVSQKVSGKENLKDLTGPVLFAANHLSMLDTPVVLAALPRGWRRRVAAAAAAHLLLGRRRIEWMSAAFFFNAFPFSQTGSIRPSMEYCGRLLDQGWSVLIYPEGARSGTGGMDAFKSGAGLLAVELRAPVVPVFLKGTGEAMERGKALPRRGNVEVRFGKPLNFPPDTSYADATASIESAVRALGGEGPE